MGSGLHNPHLSALADRWGRSALDEAQRVGHKPLIQLMQDAEDRPASAGASEPDSAADNVSSRQGSGWGSQQG